ncbi:hypothetical protein ACIBG8_01920 [Nonomuraea sp. NPDC050556]|uniref:hypothetical protein n=1 Tax=Nonomuraea sp. NPDC050556 TaxID=3364369 RepID=UPI0037B959E2
MKERMRGCGTESLAIDQALRQGVAADLIYLVELPGFTLNEQSVGVVGDEGFGAVYTADGGSRVVELRIDRDTACEPDGSGWYRSGGGRQEYTAVRGDHFIRLTAELGDVDRATMKAAVEGARNVKVRGTPSPSPPPVRRGDLPVTGDGAPVNNVGAGG